MGIGSAHRKVDIDISKAKKLYFVESVFAVKVNDFFGIQPSISLCVVQSKDKNNFSITLLVFASDCMYAEHLNEQILFLCWDKLKCMELGWYVIEPSRRE